MGGGGVGKEERKKAVDLNKTDSLFNNNTIGEREKQNRKQQQKVTSCSRFMHQTVPGARLRTNKQMLCYILIVYRQDVCFPPTALLYHCSTQCDQVS